MKYFTAFFLIVAFSSCEGYFNLEGKVLNSRSGTPVGDAGFKFIIDEKATMPLRCNLIERDSVSIQERKEFRKKNVPDDFNKRDTISFYKYCDTLVHPDGCFNISSKLINVTTRIPKATLIVSSDKHHSESVAIESMHQENMIIRLVEN